MRRLGPQVASRTRAFRHQRYGRQSATKSCSSNSAGGRQTHALHGLPRERQKCYLVLCPIKKSWSLERSNRWTMSAGKHSTKEVHVKGTLLVDAAAVVRIWRTASRQELLGNVSASEARQMLQESWFKFYGRPEIVMTDDEGCFRERLFPE